MKKVIITLVFLQIFFSFNTLKSQDINYNLYVQNPFLYNPAYAINDNLISAYLNTRMQWMGFDGAPRVNSFGINGTLNSNMGLGLTIYNSRQGIINNFNARINYAFQATMSENHYFRFGIGLGILNDRLLIDNAQNVDITDPSLSTEYYNQTNFSAGAGILYRYKIIELQVIMPQLYERKITNFYTIGVIATNINVGKSKWFLKPSVMLRSGRTSSLQFDANIMAMWDKTIWTQVGYRSNNSFIASLGFNIRGIGIGYAYQANTATISYASNGTHEIQLKLNLGERKYKNNDVVVTGHVKSLIEKTPIEADIIVFEDDVEILNVKTVDATGFYKLVLKPNKRYIIDIESDKYLPVTQIINTDESQNEKIKNFSLISKNTVLQGTITNKQTNQPVRAEINIYDDDKLINTIRSDSKTGKYKINLESGKTYTVKVSDDIFYAETREVPIAEKEEIQVEDFVLSPTITHSGVVMDRKTKSKLNARINIFKDNVLFDTINTIGDYEIKLPKAENYEIEFKANEYITKKVQLNLNLSKSTFRKDIQLDKIEKGVIFELGNIEFKTGTTRLTDESYKTLELLIEFMQTNQEVKIEISGHSDDVGSAHKNQLLSQNRATVCLNYLVRKGVNSSRIKAVGYGETKPLVPNTSKENRARNRRVEFKITE